MAISCFAQVLIQHDVSFPATRVRMSDQAPAPRSISFTIAGRIGGKGRPRGFVRGGKVAMFTPAKTVSDEAIVRHTAHSVMRGAPPLVGPIRLVVQTWRQPPVSWSLKKRAAAKWITSKPDFDNTLKLISDALNGIAYLDDAQIASGHHQKQYRLFEAECVEVLLEELEP